MKKVNLSKVVASLMLIVGLQALPALADAKMDADIAALQHDWAKANYHTGKEAQEFAFKNLSETASKLSATNPGAPEPMVWEAIILSGYAKAKGGLGALKIAEKARDLLLAAEKIDPHALQGSIYASLGSLYYKVPGWPVGFGNEKKARAYLEKALQINPTGIDPNYFYADFLKEEGEYAKAVEYFNKALAAPARPSREDADAGRKQDIEDGLKAAQRKL